MTQHIVATAAARGRMNTAVLNARLCQRRNSDHQARRRQLLEGDPQAFAHQLTRRAEILTGRIAGTLGGAS